MSMKEKDWEKIEQEYLEMKEQDFEQMDTPELWSRIEEKLDQSQSEEKTEKEKKLRSVRKKVTVCGTLAAAACLVIASWSVMRAGNSLQNESTSSMDFGDSLDSEDSHSFQENGSQQSINEESVPEEVDQADQYSDESAVDSVSKGSTGQSDVAFEEDMESVEDTMSDSNTVVEEKEEPHLLYVTKENECYEFSVPLENYDLQLVEISENKKQDVFSIAYSEFSDSAREVLQEKISDISSYGFYVDSEGVLYMERDDLYYQIHFDNRVH